MAAPSMASLRRSSKKLLAFLLPTTANPRISNPTPFSTLAQPSSPAAVAEGAHSDPSPSSSASPCRRAKSAIWLESDPIRIAEILQSSTATPDVLLDRSFFHLAVEKLARFGRHDLVEQILEPLRSRSDPTMNERLIVRIMVLYSSAGMINHAVRTFEQIPNRTEKSLCALLGVFLDNHLPGRVKECFDRVPAEIGVVPGVAAWNILLKAMCDEGEVDNAAQLVLRKMEEENRVKPNIASHNILLNAYLKKKDESGFQAVVDEIAGKGLHPDVVTYNSRITFHCRKKDLAGAEKVFDEMLVKGIKPNFASYNTLIGGFCRKGDLESANRWFVKLRHEGSTRTAADASSYVMMIRLMGEKGEFGQAVEMCKECLKKRWAPPFEVMRELVEGLVKESKAGEAREVVEMMRGCVKGPALVSWVKFESALPL